MTTFLRLVDVGIEAKGNSLREAITGIRESRDGNDGPRSIVFDRDVTTFATLPGTPFAYWVTEPLREVFGNFQRFEGEGRAVRHGAATLDDFRFLRVQWETHAMNRSWMPFVKGGAFSPFYAEIHLLLNWEAEGNEVKAFVAAKVGSASRTIQATDFYFRPGLTWPLRAHRFAPQAMPPGCIFSARGYSAFTRQDELLPTLALLNSSCFDFLFKLLLGRFEYPEFIVGILQQMPWPLGAGRESAALAGLARQAWSLKRSLDTINETSHAFVLPSGLNEKLTGIDRDVVEREIETIQKQIDEAAFALYGIGRDRAAIEASSKRPSSTNEAAELGRDDNEDDPGDDEAAAGTTADALSSWLVGVAFGRFDPRLATGERAIPPEPEPFDPLPSRSPGMWPDGEESLQRADILVDDEGHTHDLVARMHAVADRVHVDIPENFRAWLAKEFFPLHIKMYSKSRRKAPIYWQLATPSARYSAWLYIHAFSKDTLFRVQNDYVAPRLAHEVRRLESLASELRDKATAAQRKELAAQESVVEELRTFLEEVKRVAPLWNPNLDDGVIINFAPLWRLVPHNKSWQKELKSTWDALCEGKYDWAHLAMRLWPERVVPKCASDRSLAIAHGIEDVFWVEGDDGKWTARKTSTKSIEELVKDRTSAAVKSALRSLLEAPTTGTAAKPKKVRKGNAHA